MTSRFAKDPYTVSFQEVESRVSASLKAEADLKRKTEKLQKELQTSLLAHHREKIELHDFLAELRGPLGPRVVRTRKHSMGRGGGRGTGWTTSPMVSRKPNSEPTRRMSEPVTPVNHFPDFTLRDPFAWVGDDGDDSDDSSDVATVYSGMKVPEVIPDPNPKLTSENKGQGRTRKTSVWRFPESGSNLGRLPLIKAPSSKNVPANSTNVPSLSPQAHCPTINPVQTGEEGNSPDVDRPTLTISTLANLQTGTSDIRKRIQRWCENISVEFFPFAESEKQQNTESPEGADGQASTRQSDNAANPPKITVTDTNALPAMESVSINNNNKTAPISPHQPPVKSHFFLRNTSKDVPSTPSNMDRDEIPSARMQPSTPGSPWKSSKALSSRRDSTGKVPVVTATRRLSTVTATDLGVISKSMQSYHTCKIYRGRNSIPTAGTDPKVFEDLARAQHRLVQRQRVRARQNGNSYDFGEMLDAQIKKRNSARWSL